MKKDITKCVILSILTCGIYLFVWMADMQNDMVALDGDRTNPTGGTVVLLTIVTCGLYGIYWSYQIARRIDQYSYYDNAGHASDTAVVSLFLWIFGLPVVAMAINQSHLNDCYNRY